MGEQLNLDKYFERICYAGDRAPTISVLNALHVAHATHIPFENVDVLLNRPISLHLCDLFDKLVTRGRGGYCFEQNSLFAAILEQIGFSVTRLAARVLLGSSRIAPQTHMLLGVDIDGHTYLADVGFGCDCFLQPLFLEEGGEVDIFGWQHRLKRQGESWVLQTRVAGSWMDQYAFTLEEHYPVDYEVANYYVATFPQSFFRQNLVAQALRTDVRFTLHNSRLIESRSSSHQTSRTLDAGEIAGVLSQLFGIDLPPGTPIPMAPSHQAAG